MSRAGRQHMFALSAGSCLGYLVTKVSVCPLPSPASLKTHREEEQSLAEALPTRHTGLPLLHR